MMQTDDYRLKKIPPSHERSIICEDVAEEDVRHILMQCLFFFNPPSKYVGEPP